MPGRRTNHAAGLVTPRSLPSFLVSDRREAEALAWLPPNAITYVVPLPLAQELVGFNFHTGFLGCGRRPAESTVALPGRRSSSATSRRAWRRSGSTAATEA